MWTFETTSYEILNRKATLYEIPEEESGPQMMPEAGTWMSRIPDELVGYETPARGTRPQERLQPKFAKFRWCMPGH